MFNLGGTGATNDSRWDAPSESVAPKRIELGTDQQEDLWSELLIGDQHVLVEARAGSGKSSSCREGMHRLLEHHPRLLIRYAVFNKVMADEFRGGCPAGVDVGTVHSFGYAALRRAFGSVVDKNKTYTVLDDLPAGKSLPRWLRKSIALLVSQAKNQALIPDDSEITERLFELLQHYDINAYGRDEECVRWAIKALIRSETWTEIVDFDDMIWLPGMHQCEFPDADLLFLDEVQDWNPAQHLLIPLMTRNGRVIAVGDSHQAIYAWRGADPESMSRLGGHLGRSGVTNLPLTVTFRCPRSHVARAQQYVPDLTAHESNREGTIAHATLDSALQSAQPGDMVICAKNAPLVGAALQLIANRRRALVRGRAIGDSLKSIIRSVGQGARTVGQLANAVDKWLAREMAALSEREGVDDLMEQAIDRAAGLLAIVKGCSSPAEVEPAIDSLFSEEARPGAVDAVIFSTIHRAKGLEANRIFIIETEVRPAEHDWQALQQRNLRYVALTRSKDTLTFVQE